MKYTVAILGASGNVGQEMLNLLEKRSFPLKEVRLLASERSAGRKVPFRGRLLTVEAVSEKSFNGVDIALFSAGGSVSEKWAPVAAKKGAVVIDNTSAFRMDKDVPLIVPECNIDELETLPKRRIIANPNCSTIQMVQVLKPLHQKYKLRRLVISTYQSVSGSGAAAMRELTEQTLMLLEGEDPGDPQQYPHRIAFNALPHIDVFLDNGYTKEEMKMVNETRKILRDKDIAVTVTCVRVPVYRGHSEALNCEFHNKITPDEARAVMAEIPNVEVVDDPKNNDYPLASYCEGRNETYVGRVRQDISNPTGTSIDMWVVSDNLLKGAALNAIQIAEWLVNNNKITPSPAKAKSVAKKKKAAAK
jgi:aspartate-semialdehyde dehydrogenase